MKRLIGYGAMLWGFLFAVGSALYPWSVDDRPTYNGVLSITAAVATALATMHFLRSQRDHVLRRTLTAAVVWPLLCVTMDLLVFMLLPPRLAGAEAVAQLVPVYFVIAVVVAAVGIQRHHHDAHGHWRRS